jgi:methanogenic corrinoid protein MtbC1
VDRGVPISRVRGVLDAEPASREAASARSRWRHYVDRMAAAIARFDEAELDRVYDEALSVHPIEQVTSHAVLPLLVRLGERWKNVSGAIAEEHFFATYLRSKLGARLEHRLRYADGPRIVAACAPGEKHEIGLLLFALEAQLAGLRPVLLGTDTPLEDMVVALQRSNGDGIVISSSVDPAPGLLERALPKLVRKSGVPVFVGGGTAIRHRAAINAAGAVALGNSLEDGVRLISATIERREDAT